MSQARNIPLGGSSRDFTAVVDMSPTAGRDGAGVRLSATTAAESHHVVDGANVSLNTQRPMAIQRLEQAVHSAAPRRWSGPGVQVHARPRLRSVTAPTRIQTRALRERLRAEIDTLAICFTAAARSTYRVRRKLQLRPLLDAEGRIVDLAPRGGWLDAGIDRCLRERLAPALRATLGDNGGRVELELAVWMQY